MLMAMVGLVLLIACANLAELAGRARRSAAARNRVAAGDGRGPLASGAATADGELDARDCRRRGGRGAGVVDS